MMRVWPWEEPRVWGGLNWSIPRTRWPRRASWQAAALPIAPRPMTIVSKVAGMPGSRPGTCRRFNPPVAAGPRTRGLRLKLAVDGGRWAGEPGGGAGRAEDGRGRWKGMRGRGGGDGGGGALSTDDPVQLTDRVLQLGGVTL